MQSVAVCTDPRTGGQHFDRLLRAAGIGNPSEYLNPAQIRPLLTTWNVEAAEYLHRLWRERSVEGIFATRFHWHHLAESRPLLGLDSWEDALPKGPRLWVLLHRHDHVAQARSYLTAVADNDWSAGRAYRDDLDPDEVARWAEEFETREQKWRSFLATVKGEVLELEHREVVGPVAAIRARLGGVRPA